MRIWFVNQYAIPPNQAGITRHHILARKLLERGHETSVIASSFNHVTQSEKLDLGGRARKTSIHEKNEGVDWLWLPSPAYQGNSAARTRNMLAFGFRVWRDPLLRQRPKPDVIVGSSPPLPAAYGALHLARNRRCAFVAEVRDLWPRVVQELGGYSPWNPGIVALRWMESRIYHEAKRVITLLPGSETYLTEQGIEPDAISFVPNGIDPETVPPFRPPVDKDEFTVMYAGTHGFANGLDHVLDAAAELRKEPRFRFRLVGDGPDKARLRERAGREALTNVIFDEPVPKNEIYRVLAEADSFILPLNRADVFHLGLSPSKLFDYLAVGRPVIVAASGSHGSLQISEVGMEVPPSDGGAIADAVRKLAELPETKRFAMGQAGRHYVMEHRNLDLLVGELENVLEDAARPKRHLDSR